MMWSTADVMNELRDYRQLCAEISILKQRLEASMPDIGAEISELAAQCSRMEKRRDMVRNWQALLPREERFIVQTHLIDGLDWAKTVVEHEKMWGVMNGRSERTLKRMQAKAIERIVNCLNLMEAKSPSSEVM